VKAFVYITAGDDPGYIFAKNRSEARDFAAQYTKIGISCTYQMALNYFRLRRKPEYDGLFKGEGTEARWFVP
jgi:hypothetical protein